MRAGSGPTTRPTRTWEVELHTLERGDHRLSDTNGMQPTLDEVHAQLYAATKQLTAIETRIAACREEWDGRTADEVIRKHAEALETTTPQQPIIDPFVELEFSDIGWAACFEWVDPRAIVNTVDPSWGAFNRRQESIWLMLHSLLTTSDLRRILVEEFLVLYLPDVVTLHRVPGPGGALYELSVCGSHRVHTARLLDLPWLLAQTVYHGPPTAARIYHRDVRGADLTASLPGLWARLQARDLLDGDVE